eukprot:17359-Heterococcus_DN1.PRE.5
MMIADYAQCAVVVLCCATAAAVQGAGAVCQTVCMPYDINSNSSSSEHTTVRSNVSLLVTAADSADYYANLASDVPWFVSAYALQGIADGCDTDSNSVVQPLDTFTQSFEWENATGIDIDNATLIYSDCDSQQISGYTFQTVMVYTNIATALQHGNTQSSNSSSAEQHQQRIHTMHDAPLVVDDDHTGHGRAYSGTPAEFETSSNNGSSSVLWTALVDNRQGPIGANCYITLTVAVTNSSSTRKLTDSKTSAIARAGVISKPMVLTLNLGSTDSLVLYTRNGHWYDSYPPVKASASMHVSVAMDANQTVAIAEPQHNTLPEHTASDAVTAIVLVTPTVAFTRCSEHACPELRASSYELHSSVDRVVVKRYLRGVVSHLVVGAKHAYSIDATAAYWPANTSHYIAGLYAILSAILMIAAVNGPTRGINFAITAVLSLTVLIGSWSLQIIRLAKADRHRSLLTAHNSTHTSSDSSSSSSSAAAALEAQDETVNKSNRRLHVQQHEDGVLTWRSALTRAAHTTIVRSGHFDIRMLKIGGACFAVGIMSFVLQASTHYALVHSFWHVLTLGGASYFLLSARQWPEQIVLEDDDDDAVGAEMHNRSAKRDYSLVRTNSAAEE